VRKTAKRLSIAALPLVAVGVAAIVTVSNSAGAAPRTTQGGRGPLAPVAAGAAGHRAPGTAAAGTGEVRITHGKGHRLTAAEMAALGLGRKAAPKAGASASDVSTLSSEGCYDIAASNGGSALPGVTVNGAGGYQYVVWCGDTDTARLTAVQYQSLIQITNPTAGAANTGESTLGGFGEEFFEYRTNWLLCEPGCANPTQHYDDVVYEYNGNWTTIQRF
jgi:hypothetical protein